MKGHTYSKRNPALKWKSPISQQVDDILTPFFSNGDPQPTKQLTKGIARKLKRCKPRGQLFGKMAKLGYQC